MCTRYNAADGTYDPVSDMSTRSLVLTHKQHIVDQCCIWREWRDASDAWSTGVRAVVKECEWMWVMCQVEHVDLCSMRA